MTYTEYDCLNSIRYGMKQFFWWEWAASEEEHHRVFDAMSYIEDVLWAAMCANAVKLIYEEEG